MPQEEPIFRGIMELDHRSFKEVVERTDKLIIVEFYMPGCEVCQAMAPIYQQISEELSDQATFARVDAENNLDLALRYGVTGTPTYKLFCRGKFLGEIVGETNATVLRNTINDMIRHQAGCSSPTSKMPYELDGYG
jgi:thioredoxin 1